MAEDITRLFVPAAHRTRGSRRAELTCANLILLVVQLPKGDPMGTRGKLFFGLIGLCLLLGPSFPLPPETIALSPERMEPEGEHGYGVPLRAHEAKSPSDEEGVSGLILLEDGVPLPSAHELHDAIR